MNLNEVDHIEVIALMDNQSDPFSVSHPGMKWNESQYQYDERACRIDSGKSLCRACLGLSLFIRVKSGDDCFSLLFDTGPDDGLEVENAARLGVDLSTVDAVFLSHGHFDHISGIASCLSAIGKPTPVFCHPDVFVPRASRLDDGELVVSTVIHEQDVKAAGGTLFKMNSPELLFGGRILLSGEIPRITEYETGNPDEMKWVDDGWQNAPHIIDEQAVVLKLKGKGLCLFTGCGHPGVVNTLKHAQELAGQKIHLLMGGYHLVGADSTSRINATVRDLELISPDHLATGHCTGFKAQYKLTEQFGDRHIPYGVGTVFRFNGPQNDSL